MSNKLEIRKPATLPGRPLVLEAYVARGVNPYAAHGSGPPAHSWEYDPFVCGYNHWRFDTDTISDFNVEATEFSHAIKYANKLYHPYEWLEQLVSQQYLRLWNNRYLGHDYSGYRNNQFRLYGFDEQHLVAILCALESGLDYAGHPCTGMDFNFDRPWLNSIGAQFGRVNDFFWGLPSAFGLKTPIIFKPL